MKPAEKNRADPRLAQLHAEKFSALNSLAAGTAHEFNNVVAGILGSAEIIALDLPENHPARESLSNIFTAAAQGREFVGRLRELGQRHAPELKPVQLRNLVEEALPVLRTVVTGKIQFRVELANDCPPVLADAAQMQQALIELCLQCWHGLPGHTGDITLALEKFPLKKNLGLLLPGDHVRLTIRDHGPGLDKNSLGKMFAPFVLRRSGGKKVGLELFLVRETIHAHHGEIAAASEPGHGLTFQIYLPVFLE
jgi:nitrogen-specific signal transduction histidine kinase